MAAIVGGLGVGGIYDFVVAQATPNPDKWPRFYDLMSFMPFSAWVIVLLGTLVIFMFEGGFRASRSNDETISALKQEIADREGPYALPLTVSVEPPASGVVGKYRFKVCNPTGNPVMKVYGKYRGYDRIGRRPFGRWPSETPPDGTNLPWDETRSGAPTTLDIGAHSSEYLNIGIERERVFTHFGPDNKPAQKLRGGTYEFTLEIGSKASGKPISHRVRIEFSKWTEFAVKIIPPIPDTEPG